MSHRAVVTEVEVHPYRAPVWLLVLSVIGMALALVPASAAAGVRSLKFQSLATAATPVATDGGRYAVLQTLDRATRVFDTRTGRSYVVPPPGAGCWVAGLGGGQLVYECLNPSTGGVTARLLDLRSGLVREPAGLDALRRERVNMYVDVGARWLLAVRSEREGSHGFYVDWRTGELHADPLTSDRQIADLDARSLVRRLCSPLRVSGAGPTSANPGSAGMFDVEGRWAQRWVERGDGLVLQLQRCGRPNRTIARCGTRAAGACFGGQLASGRLSWTAGGRAWVLRYARGTRYRSTRVFRPARTLALVEIRHTARRVFVSVPTRRREGAYSSHEWRAYVARLR